MFDLADIKKVTLDAIETVRIGKTLSDDCSRKNMLTYSTAAGIKAIDATCGERP